MFDMFSWNDYFMALVAIIAFYYIFIALFFYQKEIFNPEKHIKKQFSGKDNHLMDKNHKPDLIGKAQPDVVPVSDYVTIDGSEQLAFPESNTIGHSQNSEAPGNDVWLLEAIAGLVQEINTIGHVVSESEGKKEESTVMIQSILVRYHHLAETKFRKAINIYILDVCKEKYSLDLSIHEIDAWWKTNNHKP